jgi:hypothetical protein
MMVTFFMRSKTMAKMGSVILTIAAVMMLGIAVGAQTTAFTYQGRLTDSSLPTSGTYDFEFVLFDALTAGSQVGLNTVTGVAVTNGIFTVDLSFGAAAFPGADRFLETRVKRPADSGYTVLSPRRQIASVPYAIRSQTVGTLGQASTTVYGSTSVTVANAAFVLVPGLTQTINVPANSVVQISTDGGIQVNSTSATAFSAVDVALFIDGVNVSDGNFKRLFALNNAQTASVGALAIENWSFGTSRVLTPGTHTITVQTRLAFGNTAAVVSGNNTSVLQGSLTVTILKN